MSVDKLSQKIYSLSDDAFDEKSNKAAGTRLRKGLQEVKKIAQELRVHIQETKNEIENKSK